jgi:hypothetical protein
MTGDRKRPVDDDEDKELIGRREALNRFAKYTAPAMLALLVSVESGGPAFASI